MSETSERKKTSEAAKELGISENTLRKYSKIVEEVTGNPAYFAHQKNARLYSPEDLEKLRQLVAKSKEPGQTLLQAASGLFAKENPEKIAQVVASLQKTIESQNQVIDSLKEELSSLKEAQKPAAPADDVLGWDDIPVICSLPCGHGKKNLPLVQGAEYRLRFDSSTLKASLSLLEDSFRNSTGPFRG